MMFNKDPVCFEVLNPDECHAKFRLRVTKSCQDREELLTFKLAASLILGVEGNISGPFGDGRFRLQYYGEDAERWAKAFDFYSTERGNRYRELTLDQEWYKPL